MKKQLLLLAGMLCIVVTAWAAPTAKAIYCAANTTLYFTYDEVTYNTSTAYDNLDGNTPTAVYDNISAEGYIPRVSFFMGGNYGNPSDGSQYRMTFTSYGAPWCRDYHNDVTKVKILDNFISWKPTSLKAFFFALEKLETIEGGENINTSDVKSLASTFFYCKSLSNLNFLSQWNVGNLISLEETFHFCHGLTDINGLANWDTSSVTDLAQTFAVCTGLTNVDGLAKWNISNVDNMISTFSYCNALSDIDGLMNWVVGDVIDMNYLFYGCAFENVDALSTWETKNVNDMQGLFSYCRQLENVDGLSNWNTGKAADMDYIFSGCSSLANCDGLSLWNVSNTIGMEGVFRNCTSLANLEGLRNWDVKNVVHFGEAFLSCSKLTTLEPIEGWNMTKISGLQSTFRNCTGLVGRIDLSNWNFSNMLSQVTTSSYEKNYFKNEEGKNHTSGTNYSSYSRNPFSCSFYDCSKVIGITLGKGNVGKKAFTDKYDKENTFMNCQKLRYIDMSGCTDTRKNVVSASRSTTNDMFNTVPRTCVIYLPSGNSQPTKDDLENVVYTASDKTLQCDKYYSEDKVDIELPHRFHADLATYERTFNSTYGGVILPYPVKINDNDEDEFQPFLLEHEFENHMFFKGSAEVPANTPFAFKRKQASTDMTFRMEDLWVESTYDISGETSDNIQEGFAWKSQGFYVNHVIEPENGTFAIPTMDDYVGTEDAVYNCEDVHYISKNRFYRCDDAPLTLAPHRILFYGQWEMYEFDPDYSDGFSIEEMDDDTVDAIKAAETSMDEAKATAIYDANGNRLSETRPGLNILRMSDGTVKKVIKK